MGDFWETVRFGAHVYQGSALRVPRAVHLAARVVGASQQALRDAGAQIELAPARDCEWS